MHGLLLLYFVNTAARPAFLFQLKMRRLMRNAANFRICLLNIISLYFFMAMDFNRSNIFFGIFVLNFSLFYTFCLKLNTFYLFIPLYIHSITA